MRDLVDELEWFAEVRLRVGSRPPREDVEAMQSDLELYAVVASALSGEEDR